MEPSNKKIKLTDHFRVALRPRDLNVVKKETLKNARDPQQKPAQNNNETALKQHYQPQGSQQRGQQPSAQPPATLQPLAPLQPITLQPQLPIATQVQSKKIFQTAFWEPDYAPDSFDYDRVREIKFINRPPISELPPRRAELVDWLVDIQISFGLDHEPLYMAIKLVDQYLMRKQIDFGQYELLFMVSMLISAKFDERIPPITISELISATRSKFGTKYTRKEVISLEVDILTTLQFDIRYPLSYGFLRRFAKCTKSDTRTLYLARYILETSLMDENMIEIIESKMAAGSLLLAFEMLHKNGAWDESAKLHTGYDEKELHPLMIKLNQMIQRLSKKKTVIRKKYSNGPFMGVARIPTLFSPPVINL